MSKHLRDLRRLFDGRGLKSELLRKGGEQMVWQLSRPGLSTRFITPVNPSDVRWAQNVEAHLRRLSA